MKFKYKIMEYGDGQFRVAGAWRWLPFLWVFRLSKRYHWDECAMKFIYYHYTLYDSLEEAKSVIEEHLRTTESKRLEKKVTKTYMVDVRYRDYEKPTEDNMNGYYNAAV